MIYFYVILSIALIPILENFFDILKQTTHLFSQNILAIIQRAKEQ
jgi:hypothetical protein